MLELELFREAHDEFFCKQSTSNTMKVKGKWVAQSYPPLCDPMDYRVYGILWARILEWVAFPLSRGSSQPRDQAQVSRIAGGFFTTWATRDAPVKQPQIKCLHLSNTTIVATASNQFIHIYTVGSPNKIIQNLKEEQYLKLHLFVSLKVRDLAFSILFFISHVGIYRRPVSYDTEDHGKAMSPQGNELCQQVEWTWRLITPQLSLLSDTFIATLWRP